MLIFCLSAIFSILEELWIFCTTLFCDCLAHLQIWDEVFCLLCKLTNFLHFLPIYTSSLEKIHNGKIPQWKKIFQKNVCFNQKKNAKIKNHILTNWFYFLCHAKKKENQLLAFNTWRLEKKPLQTTFGCIIFFSSGYDIQIRDENVAEKASLLVLPSSHTRRG